MRLDTARGSLTAALIAALLILPALAPAQDAAGDKTLTLKIGDPRFKDKTLDVAPN